MGLTPGSGKFPEEGSGNPLQHSCLGNSMDRRAWWATVHRVTKESDSPWHSPGQNTGAGSLSLLQGIFPTQGSNPSLPHSRLILYQLSYQGSPTEKQQQSLTDKGREFPSSPAVRTFPGLSAFTAEGLGNPWLGELRSCKDSKCSQTKGSSVQFSHSVMSDSLWPHGLQNTRLPCPSQTPRAYSNSCPLSRWCIPTISSSVIPFSSCLQSFPASGSFQMSQFFTSKRQRGENKIHPCHTQFHQRSENTAEHKGHLATCFGFFGILVCSMDKGEWINSPAKIKISEYLNRMHTWLDILRISVEHCCLVIKPHKNLASLNLSLGSKYQIINLSLRPSWGFKAIIGPLVQKHLVIKIHKSLG